MSDSWHNYSNIRMNLFYQLLSALALHVYFIIIFSIFTQFVLLAVNENSDVYICTS